MAGISAVIYAYGPEDPKTIPREADMPLINIVIVLIVAGVALWAINTYIPMARPVKTILNVIVVVVLCLWLLQVFGIIGSVGNVRIQ